MIKIGIISGQILAVLEQDGKSLTAKDLADILQEPIDDIHVCIGWLVREKYVQVDTNKDQLVVSLTPEGDSSARNRLLPFHEHDTLPSAGLTAKTKSMTSMTPPSPTSGPGPEQRFFQFVESMPAGIYMTDAHGIITYANGAFARMLGYEEPKELIGTNLHQELQMNPQEHANLVSDLKEKGSLIDYEIKFVRKDEKIITLAETVRAILGPEGNFLGMEGIVRDITEKKRHQEQMRIEKLKLEHILSLHEEISSILKLEELVDFVVNKSVEIIDANRCSLMLIDKERNELLIKGAKGLSDDIIHDTRIKLGEQISGLVAMYGEPMLVTDIDKESPLPRKNRPAYHGKSFLSVPIKLEKKVIGVVNVADKGRNKNEIFTSTDLRVLSAIIRQAAVAIENANLYRELKYLSITDPLTGLYNHRHFAKTLDQEIKRLKRYPAPLCLMMIDIDNFKTYNDTYGHLEGDQLLREVSRTISKNLREIDVACRYGGDEFAVILVETRIHKAEVVAKKFLHAVEQLQLKRPITLSIGIAAYSEQMDRHELILKADRALYQSKKEGRNRVSIYS